MIKKILSIILIIFFSIVIIKIFFIPFLSDIYQKKICVENYCIKKPKGWILHTLKKNNKNYFFGIIPIEDSTLNDIYLENDDNGIILKKDDNLIVVKSYDNNTSIDETKTPKYFVNGEVYLMNRYDDVTFVRYPKYHLQFTIENKPYIKTFIESLILNSTSTKINKHYKVENNKINLLNLKKYANNGNVTALNSLGKLYFEINNTVHDYKKAEIFFEEAINRNNLQATNNLATMYYLGKGVKQDYKKAFNLFKKAANQNFPDAQYNLGEMYLEGKYIPQDYHQAFKLFEKAAKQGNINALYNLGYMYEKGKGGVKINYCKAILLYQKPSDYGLANAQHALGLMYQNGKCVRQDYKQAIKFYTEVLKQDYIYAYNDIAILYYNGFGVEKDEIKACEYWKKGSKEGHDLAIKNFSIKCAK